jgi:hypothetical protein
VNPSHGRKRWYTRDSVDPPSHLVPLTSTSDFRVPQATGETIGPLSTPIPLNACPWSSHSITRR